MATYVIGDVQGCFEELQELLQHIEFNPSQDRLGFVGDLVNRGPESLETLRFIKSLKDPIIVLGNHDLHLLAMGYGLVEHNELHCLNSIMQAPDKMELLEWLREKPLVHYDKDNNFLLVHAGIPPQWSLDQAKVFSDEIQSRFTNEHYLSFFKHMHGNEPANWNDNLEGDDRWRYIINALTRIRFCAKDGKLELKNKSADNADSNLKPWFEWREPSQTKIIFGHWAALEGKCDKKNIFALDTGCVWGGTLTALRIDDWQRFCINCE